MKKLTLALFFTRGVSLHQWVAQGLFTREKALYERLLAEGEATKIIFITYGPDDSRLAKELKSAGALSVGIDVISLPCWLDCKLGKFLWSFVSPFFMRKQFSSVDVVKTNQMDGAWAAVLSSWLYRKPLYARTGYSWSLFETGTGFVGRARRRIAALCERFVYRNCTVAAVSSEHDRVFFLHKYPFLASRLYSLPNYIDCSLFNNESNVERRDRVIFVGRLNPQKNLLEAIKAICKSGVGLDIVGSGELEGELRAFVNKRSADVTFIGNTSNCDMPFLLRQYRYFLLPSLYEGMPKALLEAMACGCICIGTNVQGINEVLIDGENGILADGVNADAISDALSRAQLAADSMGAAASEYIRHKYSLNSVVRRDCSILRSIATLHE
ncbi:glycosyltransferase family 4 protein [Desulfobaculum sp. SPO524]|uniref:glycosyltransferase family 4 protein n=1 Tax=Desulfobaculum sp. SPO524 TaxID=3378071 RepID=UPI00385341E7